MTLNDTKIDSFDIELNKKIVKRCKEGQSCCGPMASAVVKFCSWGCYLGRCSADRIDLRSLWSLGSSIISRWGHWCKYKYSRKGMKEYHELWATLTSFILQWVFSGLLIPASSSLSEVGSGDQFISISSSGWLYHWWTLLFNFIVLRFWGSSSSIRRFSQESKF